LQKAGYDNFLLALEIMYGGMACGPIWFRMFLILIVEYLAVSVKVL